MSVEADASVEAEESVEADAPVEADAAVEPEVSTEGVPTDDVPAENVSAPESESDDVVVAPEPIDERAALALAIAALAEITPIATVAELAGSSLNADGVLTLQFANRLSGYPGWLWTVSLARVAESEPTVLEVELLPGDGALLAPDWVPWAERLADYQAAQIALAAAGLEVEELDHDLDDDDDDDDSDDEDDVDDLDAADFDNDGSPILHAGDLDGVDIDELDVDAHDDDEDSEDDDSDDDEVSEDDDSDEDDSEDDDDSDEDSEDDDSDDDLDDEDSDERHSR